MKKLLAALFACVLTMLSFCIPASAAAKITVSDRELVERILRVIIAEKFTVNPDKAPEGQFFAKYIYAADVVVLPDYPNEVWMHINAYITIDVNAEIYDVLLQYLKAYGYKNLIPHITVDSTDLSQAPVGEPEKETMLLPPPAVVLGDLDDNEAVTLDDALAALRGYASGAASGETGLTEAQGYAADVDGNGEVSLDDAQHILRYYTLNTLGQRNVGWVDIVVFGA